MGFIGKLRSKLSGQTREAFGSGQRFPLSNDIRKAISVQMAGMSAADLSGYTFERRHSDYRDTKSDIVIYDASGNAVFHGRESSGGDLAFWS